ncbi:hypothetical protein [Halorussus caseinilyticus]|uniref:DUF4175 domain-containing protein n=1 Tax=Halorussus caseinilyticus TaxID=3034025 RepID=A0ABD5WQ91_9EURY|nr:hypothetical protein [Halorussus sp. DT72]
MVSTANSTGTGRRLLGSLAVLFAVVAAAVVLLPNPLADAFFAAWVVGSVLIALVGGIAAWTNRTPLAWVAAVLLTGLSITAMLSFGPYVAPAAVCLLGAALLSHRTGPRGNARKTIAANPPSVRETVLKTGAGLGSIVLGAVLVYVSAVTGSGLFDACANETLACALENTHWFAVGGSVLGLLAVGVGGWLLWKQIYVARVLTSKQLG